MEEEIIDAGSAADSPLPREGEGMKEQFREHICSLENQGRALKSSFPQFDLRRELTDPMFARLTSPYVGLSVEDAYYAVHRRELQQATARAAIGGIARSIRSSRLRPEENGGSHSGSVSAVDYSKASKEQREELKSAIRAAAAKGEKIYP